MDCRPSLSGRNKLGTDFLNASQLYDDGPLYFRLRKRDLDISGRAYSLSLHLIDSAFFLSFSVPIKMSFS